MKTREIDLDVLTAWAEHAKEGQVGAVHAAIAAVMLKLGERRLQLTQQEIADAAMNSNLSTAVSDDGQTFTFAFVTV